MIPAPVLSLEGVRVVLDGTPVIEALWLDVRLGEHWVIVGPNGAGKTTLLRVASLNLHPAAGSVRVLGETLGRVDVRRLRERVAYSSPALAQRLEPGMTATEVVMTGRYAALAPWWHRYDDVDRARALTLLDRFGCAAIAGHKWATLSAGERQRTLLARALVSEPGIVLLDEPTAGLDVAGREQLVSDLAAHAADPTSPPTVLVTHHLEEIPPGFTHALALRGGRTIASGPITTVLNDAILSDCYGIALRVRHEDGRWSARLAR